MTQPAEPAGTHVALPVPTMHSASTTLDRIASGLLAGCIVAVILLQLHSLQTFPQSDSARWWGDETGQITELTAELHDGYAHIPMARAATVERTNGLVRGNSWLAAIVYGIPALAFAGCTDPITIGRIVTAVLSSVVLIALYLSLRTFQVHRALALFGVLLLAASRSFFFASHAARLDVAAALTLVCVVTYLARTRQWIADGLRVLGTRWFFITGAIATLLGTLSVHLVTLLVPVSICTLWHLGAFRDWKKLVAALCGLGAVVMMLLAVYALSGAPFTLFGITGHHTQFHNVIDEIPITKPFSLNVQLSNLAQRWKGMQAEAPAIALLVLIALVMPRSKKLADHASRKFLYTSIILTTLAWLLLEGPALYYFVQILPLVVLAAMVRIQHGLSVQMVRAFALPMAIAAALVAAYFGAMDALHAANASGEIVQANAAAIDRLLSQTSDRSALILTEPPAYQRLIQQHRNVMSPHFLEFPIDDRSPAEVIHAAHVRYLLLYDLSGSESYERAPLQAVAQSDCKLIATECGLFTDIGRSYFERSYFGTQSSRVDTLRLYEVHQ